MSLGGGVLDGVRVVARVAIGEADGLWVAVLLGGGMEAVSVAVELGA